MPKVLLKVLFLSLLSLLVGCATLIEGPKQKVKIHCTPIDDINVVVDGTESALQDGIIVLDKKRETHFITFKKEGYRSTTLSFNREVNPFWPVADLIWLWAAPVGWFLDWQTGAIYQVNPRDIHVVLRKEGGNSQ